MAKEVRRKKVVIQAGGEGSRLKPYTTIIPKPLMPVGDMPILEIVIRQLSHYGFKEIIITTGHLSHLIQSFFGDGSRWGVEISYQIEDEPLGTIGPLKLVENFDHPCLVMNGDLLTDIDFDHFYHNHFTSEADLSVACYKKSVPVSLGVIEHNPDGRILHFQEKPTLQLSVSMGIYVIDPGLLELIPPDVNFGFDLLMEKILSENRKAIVYPYQGLWLDIGRKEDYEVATGLYSQNRDKFLPG